MRLIDADALMKTYKGWLPQLESDEDAGDRNGVETCIAVLEDAPTIDAIPVAWIIKWSNKWYRETQRDVSIVDVLEAWQKEQEAR